MRKSYLANVIYCLLGVIGDRKNPVVDMETMEARCRDGTMIDSLRAEFVSFYRWIDDADQNAMLSAALKQATSDLEPSKYAIKENGLCMMAALVTEMLAHAEDTPE